MWNDDRDMADHGYHRVSLVNVTLADMASGVGMYVSDHLTPFLPAVLPQRGIAIRVEGDGARLTGPGIEVVIANEAGDATAGSPLISQQKGTALAAAGAAAPQFAQETHPKQERYADDGAAGVRRQGNLRNSGARETQTGSQRSCGWRSTQGGAA